MLTMLDIYNPIGLSLYHSYMRGFFFAIMKIAFLMSGEARVTPPKKANEIFILKEWSPQESPGPRQSDY